MATTPAVDTFYHDTVWSDHDKPRWMRATCRKCSQEWAVHLTDAQDWRAPANCVVAPPPADPPPRGVLGSNKRFPPGNPPRPGGNWGGHS